MHGTMNIKKNKWRVLYMNTNERCWSYLAQFLEWEMFQKKKVVEEIKIHILCPKTFFFFENRALYEIMWKNIVEPDRPQTTIWRMLDD